MNTFIRALVLTGQRLLLYEGRKTLSCGEEIGGKVKTATFDVQIFDVAKYDRILAKGLSQGLGKRESTMCIEAAICAVLGLPHGDDPGCVIKSARRFKIELNDSSMWSSPKARSQGLRDLGLAQLGSLGVVDDREFQTKLAEKVIRVLLPTLFRDIFKDKPDCLVAAQRCEDEGFNPRPRAAGDGEAVRASLAVIYHRRCA